MSMEGPRRKEQKKEKWGDNDRTREKVLVFQQSKYMSHLDCLQIVLHPTLAKTV